jgi:hypothetical protein
VLEKMVLPAVQHATAAVRVDGLRWVSPFPRFTRTQTEQLRWVSPFPRFTRTQTEQLRFTGCMRASLLWSRPGTALGTAVPVSAKKAKYRA